MSTPDGVRSIIGAQTHAQNALKVHSPPDGCVIKTDEEREIWESITKSKAYDRWNKASLLIAWKCLKLEIMVRRGWARLDQLMEGDANPFDRDSVSNELLKEINRLEKHMLTNLRALGLTYTAIQSSKAATATAKEHETADAINRFASRPPFLLATN